MRTSDFSENNDNFDQEDEKKKTTKKNTYKVNKIQIKISDATDYDDDGNELFYWNG